jgi:phosphatidylglycerophosphate synthase
MIDIALISASDRASNAIFGRPLLERLMINCERSGIKRFVIAAPAARRQELSLAMGRYAGQESVQFVDSLGDLPSVPSVNLASRCVAFSGNLVFSRSHLRQALSAPETSPEQVTRQVSVDQDQGGEIAVGSIAAILAEGGMTFSPTLATSELLPFALNGRPEDRQEAEVRLARSLRAETAHKDAPLARWIDRRLSWRISYRLARTSITPNMVTIANTILGLGCAWMFSIPNYWMRLAAAILFVISITIDGVDGEVARLKMCETDFGGKLDVATDNVVHVAIFIGLLTGCYRASQSAAYLYLIPILLGGFGACAYATWRAFKFRGKDAADWLDKVDRWSGRDFAYLLVIMALFNRLEYFAWGTAFGSYLFAAILIWATGRVASNPDPA